MKDCKINFEKFKDTRALFNSTDIKNQTDYDLILESLFKNMEEIEELLYQSDSDFCKDFENLVTECKEDIELIDKDNITDYEDSINFWLKQFYELCDNAGIWLGI